MREDEYVECRVRVLRADLDELLQAIRAAGMQTCHDDTEIGVSAHYGIRARIESYRTIARNSEREPQS